MSDDFEKYGRIDDYLRGVMTSAEMETFEHEMKHDAVLSNEVEAQRMTHEALFQAEAATLHHEINVHFHNKRKRKEKSKKWLFGGVGLLTILTGIALWASISQQTHIEPEKMTSSNKSHIEKTKDPKNQSSPATEKIEHVGLQTGTHNTTFLKIDSAQNQKSQFTNTTPIKTDTLAATPLISNNRTKDSLAAANNNKRSSEDKKTKLDSQTESNPCLNLKMILKMDEPCAHESNGAITVSATGGTTPYVFSLDSDEAYEQTDRFEGLYSGSYEIHVKDKNGCTRHKESVLGEKSCIEIKKSFNPDFEDWQYDSHGEEVRLEIYNVAGQKVYESEDKNPSWTGRDLNGQDSPRDVYLFMIHKNGNLVNQGQVSLLR